MYLNSLSVSLELEEVDHHLLTLGVQVLVAEVVEVLEPHLLEGGSKRTMREVRTGL